MSERTKAAASGPAAAAKQAAPKAAASPAQKVKATVAPKRTAKPVTPKPPAVSAAPKNDGTKETKPARQEKAKKVKLVRDSFTMPEDEYARIAELKKKCLQAGIHMKKSELLRAGLLSLAKLSEAELLATMGQVEILKTGRPAKA